MRASLVIVPRAGPYDRQMTYRTVEQLGDLPDQPILAVLATRREDDSILLSPVWFLGATAASTSACRSAIPSCAISRATPRHDRRRRERRRRARARGDGHRDRSADEARELGRALAIKYLGEEEGSRYADALGGGVRVRVEGRIRAWDYADLEYWSGSAKLAQPPD